MAVVLAVLAPPQRQLHSSLPLPPAQEIAEITMETEKVVAAAEAV
jgi:hypothetical protein